MMKFVVNQLPYYGELCPLWTMCSKNAKEHECPRYWDKYKVCSDENPHRLLHTLFYLCELAGFEIEGRIILIDKRNGRVWR